MFDIFAQNKEWVFSGIGVTILVAVIALGRKWFARLLTSTVKVKPVGVLVPVRWA